MSDITLETGTQILFNNVANYAPATALNDIEVATPTDVEIDLNAITTGLAEQSAKHDFTANRALAYSVVVAQEFATAPATGEVVNYFWGPSPVSVAGTGNPGYLTGVAGAYTGTPGTLAEGLAQLMYIGSLIASADANIQVAIINPRFVVPERHGMLVVENATGVTTGDAVESAISFMPIIGDVA